MGLIFFFFYIQEYIIYIIPFNILCTYINEIYINLWLYFICIFVLILTFKPAENENTLYFMAYPNDKISSRLCFFIHLVYCISISILNYFFVILFGIYII